MTVVLLRHSGADVPAAAVPYLRGARALYASGVDADPLGAKPAPEVGELLAEAAEQPVVLFAASADDPRVIALRAAGARVIQPSPGVGLIDAVRVMDRLRSPGGCPWDAEQTHESLRQYLVEETYELLEAIEQDDREALREELGDVLLQVLFHARVAAEHPGRPFDIDAVADGLVAKLVGRHPHVFPAPEPTAADGLSVVGPTGSPLSNPEPTGDDLPAVGPTGSSLSNPESGGDGLSNVDRLQDPARSRPSAEHLEVTWEALKQAEKRRESIVDGVALGQPAAALAGKLGHRTGRAGIPAELFPSGPGPAAELFRLAASARRAGIDPEGELRAVAKRFAEDVRAAEQAARAGGVDPATLGVEGWHAYWPRPKSR